MSNALEQFISAATKLLHFFLLADTCTLRLGQLFSRLESIYRLILLAAWINSVLGAVISICRIGSCETGSCAGRTVDAPAILPDVVWSPHIIYIKSSKFNSHVFGKS